MSYLYCAVAAVLIMLLAGAKFADPDGARGRRMEAALLLWRLPSWRTFMVTAGIAVVAYALLGRKLRGRSDPLYSTPMTTATSTGARP